MPNQLGSALRELRDVGRDLARRAGRRAARAAVRVGLDRRLDCESDRRGTWLPPGSVLFQCSGRQASCRPERRRHRARQRDGCLRRRQLLATAAAFEQSRHRRVAGMPGGQRFEPADGVERGPCTRAARRRLHQPGRRARRRSRPAPHPSRCGCRQSAPQGRGSPLPAPNPGWRSVRVRGRQDCPFAGARLRRVDFDTRTPALPSETNFKTAPDWGKEWENHG